ncbi:hypothetical protein B0H34DRAFT_626738, partial [Crassisporium funariophilum]
LFDVPKANKETADAALQALFSLAGNIELEEAKYQALYSEENDEEEDDNVEGWSDERNTLTKEEKAELDKAIQPVRLVLTKVCCAAFAIKNSSTLILPQWFTTLEELELDEQMMPRDVTTRWNSTYDMVDFACEFREALDAITANRSMNL